MRIMKNRLALAFSLAFVAAGSAHAAAAADDVATRVKALNDLLAEQWEYSR
jgi:hypothetical protein